MRFYSKKKVNNNSKNNTPRELENLRDLENQLRVVIKPNQ